MMPDKPRSLEEAARDTCGFIEKIVQRITNLRLHGYCNALPLVAHQKDLERLRTALKAREAKIPAGTSNSSLAETALRIIPRLRFCVEELLDGIAAERKQIPTAPAGLIEAARSAKDVLGSVEINPCNCSEVEIEELDKAASEAFEILRKALISTNPQITAPQTLIEAAEDLILSLKVHSDLRFIGNPKAIALEKVLKSCKPEEIMAWGCRGCGVLGWNDVNSIDIQHRNLKCPGTFIELVARSESSPPHNASMESGDDD